jgi:hypothetical protein
MAGVRFGYADVCPAKPGAQIFKGTRTILLPVPLPHANWRYFDHSKQENA